MAYVSHLPQLVSSLLTLQVGDAVGPDGLRLAGPGLESMTRLASSSGDLWAGILDSNADFVAEAARTLAAALTALGDRLDDRSATIDLFARAGEWRRRLAQPSVV